MIPAGHDPGVGGGDPQGLCGGVEPDKEVEEGARGRHAGLVVEVALLILFQLANERLVHLDNVLWLKQAEEGVAGSHVTDYPLGAENLPILLHLDSDRLAVLDYDSLHP